MSMKGDLFLASYSSLRTVILGVMTLGICASGSAAEFETDAQQIARGKTTYRVYCAVCHGVSATGDGPMKEVLRVPPSDLTILADPKTGTFPTERVHRSIDGRDRVLGHGSREMPVWGLTFQTRGRDTDEAAEVRARIRDLVAFLASIQGDQETTVGREQSALSATIAWDPADSGSDWGASVVGP